MTNSEIVEELVRGKVVEDIAHNIKVTGDYYDDFVQDIYLTLLEYDNDKLNQMRERKQLNFFVARICTNNWNSKTSPFFCKYKRPQTHINRNIDLTIISDKI